VALIWLSSVSILSHRVGDAVGWLCAIFAPSPTTPDVAFLQVQWLRHFALGLSPTQSPEFLPSTPFVFALLRLLRNHFASFVTPLQKT
jgi:hypothetical protein